MQILVRFYGRLHSTLKRTDSDGHEYTYSTSRPFTITKIAEVSSQSLIEDFKREGFDLSIEDIRASLDGSEIISIVH